MYAADAGSEAWCVCVGGDGDDDFYVVGCGAAFELGACFEYEFDPASGMHPHLGFDPYQWFDLGVEPVGHEFEFAIGWDEGDCSVVLEA